MVRYTILMDWRSQYSKDTTSIQIDMLVKYNSYQNPRRFFVDTDILRFMESKGTRRAETILRKKNKSVIRLSNFMNFIA